MKKSVLIISLNYFPEVIGIGKYNTELAQGLVKHKLNPVIITTFPHYPEFTEKKNYFYKKEIINQITVYRCPCFLFKKNSNIRRIFTYMTFSLAIIPILILLRISGCRKVISISPTILTAIPIRLIFYKNCTRHLHVQDFEIDAAIGLNMLTIGVEIIRKFELLMLQCFNSFSSISDSMKSKLIEKVPSARPVVIRNWASYLFDKNIGINTHEIDLPEKFVLYSGNLGKKQGLELIVKAAEQLPDHNFVICGGGSHKHELLDLVASKQLINIRFLPLQPEEKFYDLLTKATIHLVLSRSGLSASVFPSKLTNIMATQGAAIVSGDLDSDLQYISKKYRCFEFIETDDTDALVNKIEDLSNDRIRLNKLKQNAKRYADRFLDRDVEIEKFVTLMDRQ